MNRSTHLQSSDVSTEMAGTILKQGATFTYSKRAPQKTEFAVVMEDRGFVKYGICGQLMRSSDRTQFQVVMICFMRTHSVQKQRHFLLCVQTDEVLVT